MANRIPSLVPLDYNLPSTVESVQQSWIATCQSSMLISGSLTILAAILLVFFKNNEGGALALEIFGYAALFLNISACTSCFILIDRLGNMSWDASQNDTLLHVGKAVTTQQNLLRMFGIGALWRWVMWHWLFCFIFGLFAIFAEILTYVWMNKSTEVKISAMILAVFSLLPFFAFILSPIVSWSIDTLLLKGHNDSVISRSRSVSDVESPRLQNMIRQRTPAQSIRTPTSQRHVIFPPIKT